jgi:cysteine desulfurase family protein (TIGR01976 family)
MPYDLARIRACYPALADGSAYLDGAAGTQVPTAVIDATAAAYAAGLGNAQGGFPASDRSDVIVAGARQAVADLVGGVPDGVVLGPNSTSLIYLIATALARGWAAGDEIVLTRLDHDANVRPWVQWAQRTGVTVRWVDPVLPACELPAEAFDDVLGDRTRLVAVTAASNVVGTRPDVAAIADRAHRAGALLMVDGVHATPHGPIDVSALGADLFVTSSYKWSGPHLAALIADPGLLEDLWPDKLASSSDTVPERFERGTLPFADLAGLVAAVDHLAGLDDTAGGTRRQRLQVSMAAVERFETELFTRLTDGLGRMRHVQRIGSPVRCAPTAYFTVDGHTPAAVSRRCADAGVNVWHGHNYAWELTGLLGIRDTGSAARAGLVHYNGPDDVDRLLDVLATLR